MEIRTSHVCRSADSFRGFPLLSLASVLQNILWSAQFREAATDRQTDFLHQVSSHPPSDRRAAKSLSLNSLSVSLSLPPLPLSHTLPLSVSLSLFLPHLNFPGLMFLQECSLPPLHTTGLKEGGVWSWWEGSRFWPGLGRKEGF